MQTWPPPLPPPPFKETSSTRYPGLGLDLRYHDQTDHKNARYPIGAHPNCHDSVSEMLLVREVAMMLVMDRLSDKPYWHVKVFDDDVVAKWKAEALALPIGPMHQEIVTEADGVPVPNKMLDEASLQYVRGLLPGSYCSSVATGSNL